MTWNCIAPSKFQKEVASRLQRLKVTFQSAPVCEASVIVLQFL